jgi:hypothetical protein
MAATAKDIKDFFALSGNNPAVTNTQLVSLDAWLEDHTGETGADALIDYWYKTLREQVISHKRATSTHSW